MIKVVIVSILLSFRLDEPRHSNSYWDVCESTSQHSYQISPMKKEQVTRTLPVLESSSMYKHDPAFENTRKKTAEAAKVKPVLQTKANVQLASSRRGKKIGAEPVRPCKYFAARKCFYGNSCYNSHQKLPLYKSDMLSFTLKRARDTAENLEQSAASSKSGEANPKNLSSHSSYSSSSSLNSLQKQRKCPLILRNRFEAFSNNGEPLKEQEVFIIKNSFSKGNNKSLISEIDLLTLMIKLHKLKYYNHFYCFHLFANA